MGDFWLDLEFCKFDMDKRMDYVSGEPVADKTNEFVLKMLHHLEKKTKPLLNTPTFAAAIICDPRLNIADTYTINEAQREVGMVRNSNPLTNILCQIVNIFSYFLPIPTGFLIAKICPTSAGFQRRLCGAPNRSSYTKDTANSPI